MKCTHSSARTQSHPLLGEERLVFRTAWGGVKGPHLVSRSLQFPHADLEGARGTDRRPSQIQFDPHIFQGGSLGPSRFGPPA